MKPFIVSFFSSICFLLLQACGSSPTQHQTVVSPAKIALPDYLEQYIGQDVSSIRRELNLRQLGYETLGAPIQTPNQLSYTRGGSGNLNNTYKWYFAPQMML